MRVILLTLVVLTAQACPRLPDGMDSGVPPLGFGGGGGEQQFTWVDCRVPTRWRVAQVVADGGCNDGLRANEYATLEQTGVYEGVLQLGADAVPVQVGRGCVVRGASCGSADGGDWRALDVALEYAGDGGWRATFNREAVGGNASTCAQRGSAFLTEPPTCDLEGAWAFTVTPSVTEGACGNTWSAPLTIEADSIGFSSTTLPLTIDRATCTASGQRGQRDGGSFWSFNNAMREARVEVTLRDGQLTGRIEDQLDRPAFGGVTCDGGVYTFAAERPTRDVTELPTTCATPKPFIRNNEVCEADAGETCVHADCMCGSGHSCRDEQCVITCAIGEDCGPGRRCGTRGYCVPEGPSAALQACAVPDDCAAGLTCGAAFGQTTTVCVPDCRAASQTCPTNSECRSGACLAFVPMGGACASASVCVAVNGIRVCAGGTQGEQYCSQQCTAATDCPAPFTTCSSNYCRK